MRRPKQTGSHGSGRATPPWILPACPSRCTHCVRLPVAPWWLSAGLLVEQRLGSRATPALLPQAASGSCHCVSVCDTALLAAALRCDSVKTCAVRPAGADAVAVDPPSSRAHTSGARPSSDGFTSALHIGSQAVAAAADSGGMRSERAFGASPGPGSVGAAPAPSSLLQPRETDRLTDPAPANGITIGPASRVTRGSLSKSAAQQQQQQQAPASSSDDHRGSSPELEAPADAMQPMQGAPPPPLALLMPGRWKSRLL